MTPELLMVIALLCNRFGDDWTSISRIKHCQETFIGCVEEGKKLATCAKGD